jgi:hypothetical protein
MGIRLKSKLKESQAPGLRDHVSNPRRNNSRSMDLSLKPIRFKTSKFKALIFETLKFGIENSNSNSNIISNDN